MAFVIYFSVDCFNVIEDDMYLKNEGWHTLRQFSDKEG